MNSYEARDILGVDSSATAEEIKRAYKKLAQRAHPDRGGSAAEFQRIQEAYQLLLEKPKSPTGNGSHSNFWKMYDEYDMFNYEDFLYNRNRERKPDLTVTVKLDLADTFTAHQRTVVVSHQNNQESIQVNIPAGVEHGSVIKLHPGFNQKTFWQSLAVVILVYLPQGFNIVEDEQTYQSVLTGSVTINSFVAMIGTEVLFTTVDKRTLKLKIPAGTNSGTRLRIPGHGLYNHKTSQREDLLVVVNVKTPQLSSQDIATLENLGFADKYF